MPNFQQITLDRTHHKNVVCCKCNKKLRIGGKAWRHFSRRNYRYYCSKCYRKIWR